MSRGVFLLVFVFLAARVCAFQYPQDNLVTERLQFLLPDATVEQYTAETKDGWYLSVQRIKGSGPPVILQHGFIDWGFTWTVTGNTTFQPLATMLWEAGFDVWLTNSRGTTLSTEYTHASPSDEAYWEFSYDEMARYDDPAFLDLVESVTGVSKIGWVGHSQGTTQMFAALSEDYGHARDRVGVFVALAPVAQLVNTGSELLKALADLDIIDIFKLVHDWKFVPDEATLHKIFGVVCDFHPELCTDFLVPLCGPDKSGFNATQFPWIVTHEPSFTSLQDLAHWAQGVKNPGFHMFDWGSAEANQQHYNQTTPPAYDLTAITKTPIALFFGSEDYLGDPKDVAWLAPQLKTLVQKTEVPGYSHLQFVWDDTAWETLYPSVESLLRRYLSL